MLMSILILMPNVECGMPNAECQMPNAHISHCKWSHKQIMSISAPIRDTHLQHAPCRMPHAPNVLMIRSARWRGKGTELKLKPNPKLKLKPNTQSGHNEATLTFDWRFHKLYVKLFNGPTKTVVSAGVNARPKRGEWGEPEPHPRRGAAV